MLLDLFAPFVVGLVGSLHCLGMCGPLVIAYSLHINRTSNPTDLTRKSSLRIGFHHHLFFHSGRLVTYGFLGALAAGLFYLADLGTVFFNLRGGVTLVGGGLMIFLGLVLLRIIPPLRLLQIPFQGTKSLWGRRLSPLSSSQRLGSKIVLGLATGFLPCGLSWAMIAKAATTQSIAFGCLTMVAFGLGTVPALFITGFSASYLSLKVRVMGEKIAALSIIIMGTLMVMKGWKIFG